MSDMPSYARSVVSDEKAAEVEAQLAAAFGEPTPVEIMVEPEAAEKESVEPIEAVEPVAEAADVDPSSPAAEAVVEEKSPTLPDNVQRALIATGWTPDEIREQHAALGVEFEKIADKVYQKRVLDSREWAAHGRLVTESDTAHQPPKPDNSTSPSGLQRIDADALKAEFGHDEAIAAVIDRMAGPMNLSIEALNKILPTVAESQARHRQSEDTILRQSIDGFFNSRDLAAYSKYYGSGSTEKLADQDAYKNRMMVLQYADQLRTGATYQGRELDLDDALSLAHDAVSGDWKMSALRDDLKTKMQKRQASITLKPNESAITHSQTDDSRSPRTRAELEAHAAETLRQVFRTG